MKYPKWVYEIVAKHLQCSMREASDAVDMYEISAGGQSELADILFKYGVEEKEVRKLGLNIVSVTDFTVEEYLESHLSVL